MSKAERLLSYAILSTITSRPLASAPTTGISINEEEDDEDADSGSRNDGHMNSDGAWCWRQDCEGNFKSLILWEIWRRVWKSVLGWLRQCKRRARRCSEWQTFMMIMSVLLWSIRSGVSWTDRSSRPAGRSLRLMKHSKLSPIRILCIEWEFFMHTIVRSSHGYSAGCDWHAQVYFCSIPGCNTRG